MNRKKIDLILFITISIMIILSLVYAFCIPHKNSTAKSWTTYEGNFVVINSSYLENIGHYKFKKEIKHFYQEIYINGFKVNLNRFPKTNDAESITECKSLEFDKNSLLVINFGKLYKIKYNNGIIETFLIDKNEYFERIPDELLLNKKVFYYKNGHLVNLKTSKQFDLKISSKAKLFAINESLNKAVFDFFGDFNSDENNMNAEATLENKQRFGILNWNFKTNKTTKYLYHDAKILQYLKEISYNNSIFFDKKDAIGLYFKWEKDKNGNLQFIPKNATINQIEFIEN